MLTEQQLIEVKNEYINLIKSISRKDCDIDAFIEYLENSDFFSAPASAKHHCAFPGGLCLHSLNVYKILQDMTNRYAKKSIDNPNYQEGTDSLKKINVSIYSRDTILIVALLHDLSKINFYEKTSKNEKEYCAEGDKEDALGKFRWKTAISYKVKSEDSRDLGNKGINSYLRASRFFALSEEEMMTLIYQYSSTNDERISDLSSILAKNNLAVFLHSADIIATYCIEK